MKYFLPSMIEVPFGEYYKKCVQLLIENGFISFHIDFGDNIFIKRKLLPWDKINYLKSLDKDIKLTAHIMCKSGTHNASLEKLTEKCLEYKFKSIYYHPRSFVNVKAFKQFINNHFLKKNKIFGVASEVVENNDVNMVEVINEVNTSKVLQMGVPLGNGGQKFKNVSLDIIDNLLNNCSSIKHIELDGGLTMNIIKNLLNSKINSFAGWSIIEDKSPKNMINNALKIKKILL